MENWNGRNRLRSCLVELLAARDTTFTKYLTPGLPEKEIRHIIVPTGVHLPGEIVAFYGRFNLPRGYQYSPDQPTLFGTYWLLSLEDAVEEHAKRRTIDYFEEKESYWFPLFQEDANCSRCRQLHSQPTLAIALSAIAFGPHTLHFANDAYDPTRTDLRCGAAAGRAL